MIGNLISQFVRDAYHIPDDMHYELKTVDSYQLLNANRLDVVAKLIYLEQKELCPNHARNLYLEQEAAMTKGSFVEAGSDKCGKEAFLESFDDLYASLKEYGYRDDLLPIPVDRNMQLLDGAHRAAAAIALHIPVHIVQLPLDAVYDTYDSDYFIHQGLSSDSLDEIVLRYIQLKNNTICINRWPSAKGHDEEFMTILKREYHLVYQKDVQLNENGAFQYLAQIYQEYSWAQNSEEGFSGVYRKLVPCFPEFTPVHVYFVETDDFDKLVRVKEEMRAIYSLEKHSMHATDTHEETIQMSELLLSRNTIDFMNHCNTTKYSSTFKLMAEAKHYDLDHTVFTGSIVLALYGIREANDLDFLSDLPYQNSHNDLLQYYSKDLNSLLYDPKESFTYFGIRFLTLDNIKEFKKNRNEGKDSDDLKLIDLILNKTGHDSLQIRFLQWKRRTAAKIQGIILRTAHRTGTYDMLRKCYKKLKGKK